MEKYLNIVTLNIPYPPDYGGMIDTFHRIRTLHNSGVGIHLHCFSYGRAHSPELELLCKTVTYYKREQGLLHQFSHLPYIVSTRISRELVKCLSGNDHPILFDGIHTTGIITDPALSSRKKLVRVHNIEHLYYMTLAGNESNPLKKLYYLTESFRLKKYEKVLASADYLLSVSPAENNYFNNRYHNSVMIPSSHPFDIPDNLSGSGEYIIYHGDLSVSENSAIAGFLASEVFPHSGCQCVIAGKNPPEWLKIKAGKFENIRLVADPDNSEMTKLIREAHINILPVTKMNGLKLKLLFALYSGRHLVINSEMAKGLDPGIRFHVANSKDEMLSLISELMQQPFTDEMISERMRFLSVNFNNVENVNKLINLI